ncbi:MAG TPA: DcaP family trimeric outer membrane transporter [Polyangiaceae bacterium]
MCASACALLLALTSKSARAESTDSQRSRLDLYGFMQLDYIQDFQRVDPAWDATLVPSRIPTTPNQYGSDGQAVLSVRQTRFGVIAALPAEQDARGVIEFDFFGVGADAGKTTPRLRHAYGQWRFLLAGQTWSTFMDSDMYPNYTDYWGPAGWISRRTPQLRLSPLRGTHELSIAIERPSTTLDPSLTNDLRGLQPVPDLTAHYRWTGAWGHLQLAGLARKLGYEPLADPQASPHGSSLGMGFHLSSLLVCGGTKFRLSTAYGNGIASYVNDGGVDLAASSASALSAQRQLAVLAYYDQTWTDQLSTSVGYSASIVSNTALQPGNAFQRGDYATATLIVSPVKGLNLAAAYLWGRRSDANAATGTDNRLQLSVKYSFSSRVK